MSIEIIIQNVKMTIPKTENNIQRIFPSDMFLDWFKEQRFSKIIDLFSNDNHILPIFVNKDNCIIEILNDNPFMKVCFNKTKISSNYTLYSKNKKEIKIDPKDSFVILGSLEFIEYAKGAKQIYLHTRILKDKRFDPIVIKAIINLRNSGYDAFDYDHQVYIDDEHLSFLISSSYKPALSILFTLNGTSRPSCNTCTDTESSTHTSGTTD